jgi:hypothetical protein
MSGIEAQGRGISLGWEDSNKTSDGREGRNMLL